MKSHVHNGAGLCRCLWVSTVSSHGPIGRSILDTDDRGSFEFNRLLRFWISTLW